MLARRDDTGAVSGISVDLARWLADDLQVPLQLSVFETAGKAVSAVAPALPISAFSPAIPIAFTEPYLLIKECYLVRKGSSLQNIAEVDVPGLRLTVGGASAYDLLRSREIQHAVIERAPTSRSLSSATASLISPIRSRQHTRRWRAPSKQFSGYRACRRSGAATSWKPTRRTTAARTLTITPILSGRAPPARRSHGDCQKAAKPRPLGTHSRP